MKIFCKNCSNIFTVEAGDSPNITCPECSSETARPKSELDPGVVVGDFRIDSHLSDGGMGTVYQATQISLDRSVALKILHKEFVNDREYVAGLFREARAAAKISHPNVVQAYAVGRDGDHVFFAMELVRGDTLKNIVRKDGALPPAKAAKIVCDVAHALDVAWREQQLVHQDIKPDNIMLDINGFTKLADLGLAKSGSVKEDNLDSDEVLGTPQYISPEQLTGVPTDVRSDIYSLGATFYHIVTGKLPYSASDMNELARLHNEGNLVPPKNVKADLPDDLNNIIIKMMARSIDQRYQSTEELIADLESFLNVKSEDDIGGADKKDQNNERKIKISVTPKIVPKINVPSAAVKSNIPKTVTQKTDAPKPVVVKPVTSQTNAPKPVAPKPVVVKPVTSQTNAPKPVTPKPVVPNPLNPVTPVNSVEPSSLPGAIAGVESDTKKEKKSSGRKIVKIVLFVVLGVFLLAVVAGGILYALEVSGKMSPLISPYVDKIVRKSETAEKQEETESVSEQQNDTVQEQIIPENLPTSSSTLEEFEISGRREYMVAVSEIFQWRSGNPDANEELLKKIDTSWPTLCYPITPLEMAEFGKIKMMFSGADEYIRCIGDREQLRKKHLSDLALAEQYLAEQKKAEAEAAEKKQLEQQEAARVAAENAKLQQENVERNRVRLAEIKSGCDKQLSDCVVAMLNSLLVGNDSRFNDAITSANTFISSTATFNNEEKKVTQQLSRNLNALKAEKKKMAVIFAKFGNINRKYNLRIDLARGTALLCEMKHGKLRYYDDRLRREFEIAYTDAVDRTRLTLFIALAEHPKLMIKNAEFYCDLFHRKRPADNKVPTGFWKNIWPAVKNSL